MQAKAEAAANRTTQDRELLQQQRTFALGQRVMHSIHGYRGVICGCVSCLILDATELLASSWKDGSSPGVTSQNLRRVVLRALVAWA